MRNILAIVVVLSLSTLLACAVACEYQPDWAPPAPAVVDSIPTPDPPRNIVGDLSRWAHLPFSHTPGDDALSKANYARSLEGQGPVQVDLDLHALALRKATIAAERGIKDHIGGSMGGAKCEGVGHSYGRFMTCCLNEPGTHAGAAMVQGRDGWYCCFLLR